jgi:hypothetical protein
VTTDGCEQGAFAYFDFTKRDGARVSRRRTSDFNSLSSKIRCRKNERKIVIRTIERETLLKEKRKYCVRTSDFHKR